MYKSRENQHMIDILVCPVTFCVLAVSSVVIHTFRSTYLSFYRFAQMDDNYTAENFYCLYHRENPTG